MPILARETDLYPEDLLQQEHVGHEEDRHWWAMYTLSRREKDLMRKLAALDVPFYSPIIAKRNRSPSGRIRTSHLPMFTNYVFVYGDDEQRYEAVSTGCVSKCIGVDDGTRLTSDLRQLHRLIDTGERVTPESQFQPGEEIRVRTGPFRGFEGSILRREGETRLLVYVNFLQRGASVLLDDCEVERLNWARNAEHSEELRSSRKRNREANSTGLIWAKSTKNGNWQATLSSR